MSESPKAFRTSPVDPVKGDVPKAQEVEKFHTNADTDGSMGSIHHTLGPSNSQASPGNHDHRGGSSVELLGGVTITGSRSGGAALQSVISVLVELGAKDSTVA